MIFLPTMMRFLYFLPNYFDKGFSSLTLSFFMVAGIAVLFFVSYFVMDRLNAGKVRPALRSSVLRTRLAALQMTSQRYVPEGLNDEAFFTTGPKALKKHLIGSGNPFAVQEREHLESPASMLTMATGQPGAEPNLAILISGFSEPADGGSVSTELAALEKILGQQNNFQPYRCVVFSPNNGNPPTSQNLARLMLQLKDCHRQWNNILVVVTANVRTAPINFLIADALVSEFVYKKELGQTEEDIQAEKERREKKMVQDAAALLEFHSGAPVEEVNPNTGTKTGGVGNGVTDIRAEHEWVDLNALMFRLQKCSRWVNKPVLFVDAQYNPEACIDSLLYLQEVPLPEELFNMHKEGRHISTAKKAVKHPPLPATNSLGEKIEALLKTIEPPYRPPAALLSKLATLPFEAAARIMMDLRETNATFVAVTRVSVPSATSKKKGAKSDQLESAAIRCLVEGLKKGPTPPPATFGGGLITGASSIMMVPVPTGDTSTGVFHYGLVTPHTIAHYLNFSPSCVQTFAMANATPSCLLLTNPPAVSSSLLLSQAALGPRIPPDRPALSTWAIPREQLMAELLTSVKEERKKSAPRIIGLVGHMGSGKTNLAAQLCFSAECLRKFEEGVFYINLSELTPERNPAVGNPLSSDPMSSKSTAGRILMAVVAELVRAHSSALPILSPAEALAIYGTLFLHTRWGGTGSDAKKKGPGSNALILFDHYDPENPDHALLPLLFEGEKEDGGESLTIVVASRAPVPQASITINVPFLSFEEAKTYLTHLTCGAAERRAVTDYISSPAGKKFLEVENNRTMWGLQILKGSVTTSVAKAVAAEDVETLCVAAIEEVKSKKTVKLDTLGTKTTLPLTAYDILLVILCEKRLFGLSAVPAKVLTIHFRSAQGKVTKLHLEELVALGLVKPVSFAATAPTGTTEHLIVELNPIVEGVLRRTNSDASLFLHCATLACSRQNACHGPLMDQAVKLVQRFVIEETKDEPPLEETRDLLLAAIFRSYDGVTADSFKTISNDGVFVPFLIPMVAVTYKSAPEAEIGGDSSKTIVTRGALDRRFCHNLRCYELIAVHASIPLVCQLLEQYSKSGYGWPAEAAKAFQVAERALTQNTAELACQFYHLIDNNSELHNSFFALMRHSPSPMPETGTPSSDRRSTPTPQAPLNPVISLTKQILYEPIAPRGPGLEKVDEDDDDDEDDIPQQQLPPNMTDWETRFSNADLPLVPVELVVEGSEKLLSVQPPATRIKKPKVASINWHNGLLYVGRINGTLELYEVAEFADEGGMPKVFLKRSVKANNDNLPVVDVQKGFHDGEYRIVSLSKGDGPARVVAVWPREDLSEPPLFVDQLQKPPNFVEEKRKETKRKMKFNGGRKFFALVSEVSPDLDFLALQRGARNSEAHFFESGQKPVAAEAHAENADAVVISFGSDPRMCFEEVGNETLFHGGKETVQCAATITMPGGRTVAKAAAGAGPCGRLRVCVGDSLGEIHVFAVFSSGVNPRLPREI